MRDSQNSGTTWVNCNNSISTLNSLTTTFGSLGFKVVSITLLFKNLKLFFIFFITIKRFPGEDDRFYSYYGQWGQVTIPLK